MQFNSSGSQSSQKFYVTDSNNNNLYRDSVSDFTEENIDYNIDASASTLLLNMVNKNPNAYTSKEEFSALSPEARRIWSKIPPDMRAIILQSRAGSSNDGANNHINFFIKT